MGQNQSASASGSPAVAAGGGRRTSASSAVASDSSGEGEATWAAGAATRDQMHAAVPQKKNSYAEGVTGRSSSEESALSASVETVPVSLNAAVGDPPF